MSAVNATSSKFTTSASRWRLWVDGSGGYLLLTGDRWTVGGVSDHSVADIRVRADWPRLAGRIERESGDYFWSEIYRPGSLPQDRILITHGGVLPIRGSAQVKLVQPSPLTATAVLDLAPPHRYDQHIDRVILVNQTLLIGPTAECHVPSAPLAGAAAPERFIMAQRGDRWLVGTAGNLRELIVGKTTELQSTTMLLEES